MKLFLTFLLPVSLLLGSCKDIVATDISNITPVLIVPTAGDTLMSNPVLFKWEEVDGATKYRLQVVSPSFSTISDYILDTIVSGTQFTYSLDSTVFELKLTAMNAGYSSQTLGPVQFWVGVSPTVNLSQVVLTGPDDGDYVNASFNNQFTWQPLQGANTYEFSLREGTNFSTGFIVHTQNAISTAQYTLPGSIDLEEGSYSWGVKAYFSSGETYYSTRTFLLDQTAPNIPSLLNPAAMSFLSPGAITFSWSNGSDGGTIHSPVRSVIQISDDSGFSNILFTDDIIGSSATFNLSTGSYYWRVYNYDEAGNVSSYSQVNQFIVS